MIISSENDWNQWEEWNKMHGSVFQSSMFARAIKSAGMAVELLIARQQNSIVGGSFACIPFPKGISSFFTEYRIVHGPIISDPSAIPMFLEAIETRANMHHAIAIQLKIPYTGIETILEKKGYTIAQHAPTYSFHIDLKKSEQALWDELDKKTRNAVRKAQKNNVHIRKAQLQELQQIYALYLKRAKTKQSWIPYPYSFFEALGKAMYPEHLSILVAEYQGNVIAEAMFLKYNKIMYYFNNGSLPEYWHLCANSLLVWEAMLIGKQKKCSLFDLYGTSNGSDKNDPNYSLYQFKSGFGGKLLSTTTFATRILAPVRKKVWDIALPIALPAYKYWTGDMHDA